MVKHRSALGTIGLSLVITASSLLVSQVASAEAFYRWTDSKNVTHYSKRKPVGVEAELINTKTFTPVEEEKTDVAKAAQSDEDAQICETAKANLEALSAKGIIKLRDEYGNQKELNQEEREAQKQRAKDAIKTYCK